MDALRIRGGKRLKGEWTVQNAKNAALPIMAGAILTEGKTVLRDCPRLSDISDMGEILRTLGCGVHRDGGTLEIDPGGLCGYEMPEELSKRIRSSIFLLGPILARFRRANVSLPGGCEIGLRPIDLHLSGLRQLGVQMEEEGGVIRCDGRNMHPATVHFDYPSVGATENVMMAAALLRGETVLNNVAREPEILDLQRFLNAMGAKITGAGTNSIRVQGVSRLTCVEYRPMPDRIAAGTLLAKFFEDGDEVPCLVNVCAVGNPGDAYEFLKPGAEAPAPAAEAPAAEAPAAAAAPAAPKAELTAISPRAMAKAVANNVNPALATGTGPKGRIIERDIDKLIASGAAAAYAAPTAAAPAAAEFEDVKWSPVRKATAKSMTKSLSTMAQLTQQYSFDATQIQAYRAMLKPLDAPMGKVSLNDMVMFAVAKTIKSCPDLNANVLEENVVRHFNTVNLGFACDTPRGLIVPTIFNADQMTLLELSMEAKRLAAEAREGKLSPDYMSGATFTISNIGSFGCEAFTPVINPPQTGILGVCNIQTKIKSAKDGVIETYPAMGLSLTFDHRVIDGAPAARYMSELCKSLENFMTLLAK